MVKLEETLKKLKETSGDDFLPLVEMMKRKARKGLLKESVEDIDRIVDKLYQKDEQPKNLHEDVLSLISELENAEQDYEVYQESRLDKMTNEELENILIEELLFGPLLHLAMLPGKIAGKIAGAISKRKSKKTDSSNQKTKQLQEYSEALINQAKAYKASLSEEEFANLISDPDLKEFFESLYQKDNQPKNLHEDVLISKLENAEQGYEVYQESRLDKMTNEEFEQALIESMNIQPLNEIGLIGAGLIGAAAGAAATGISVGIGKLIKHGKKRKQIKQLTEYSEALINQAKAYKASLSEEEFANLISDPDIKEFFESLDEKPVVVEKKPIELSENKLELTLEELLKVD